MEALDKAAADPEVKNFVLDLTCNNGGVEPHIVLEVKQATGKDDDGDNVKYSDFSAFYAPSVGDQIINWYAKK